MPSSPAPHDDQVSAAANGAPKVKLRPVRDVLHRILWDTSSSDNDSSNNNNNNNGMPLDPSQIVFGYEDRVEGGPKECLVADYREIDAGGEIPEHRILYVRRLTAPASDSTTIHEADILWDKASRVDRLFGSGNTAAGRIPATSLATVRQGAATMRRLAAVQQAAVQQQAAHEIRQQLAAQHFANHNNNNNNEPDDDNNSPPRKRQQLEEDVATHDPTNMTPPLPATIHQLRLEAIFHPKFENESQTDREIRRQMHARVVGGGSSTTQPHHIHVGGYLEVSLKHSGSLLLWSGGARFYSKNATDNVFTHVGEILLRQHVARVAAATSTATATDESLFDACSAYVAEHRLTLAFEAVTAVLGDHGERPQRDFLILTAVAERGRQPRFWGTDEIVAFAQRFGLPHNDAWVFGTPASVAALFDFYDQARETSYAADAVQALSAAADVHLQSMLPHVAFQGNILEGIVIRYVAAEASTGGNLGRLEALATCSREIAEQVPASRPDTWELLRALQEVGPDGTPAPSLLTVNLRELYAQTKFGKREGATSFAAAVAQVMDAHDRRHVERLPKTVSGPVDWPSWTRDLLHNPADAESQRIAKLMELLARLNVRVDYSLLREANPGNEMDRWLCIVHVLHDFSFQKYRKNKQPEDMALFRGFAVEINGNANATCVEDDKKTEAMQVDTPVAAGGSLMLKMKFLPYMVRTFGCRNGLGTLRHGGVEGFMKYVSNLLSKWTISSEGRQNWLPFFRGWAEYALPRMDQVIPEETDLRLLTSENYLEHLERYEALYKDGKITCSSGPTAAAVTSGNQGLVVVVAPRKAAAKAVADMVARSLDDASRLDDVNDISMDAMATLCVMGHGAVCSAALNDRATSLRKLLNNYGKFISIILVGCSDEDIQTDIDLAADYKMYRGLANAWRKTRAVMVLEMPSSVVFPEPLVDSTSVPVAEPSEVFHSEMEKIKLVFQAEDAGPPPPGILVFFPAIPGSGKSSFAGAEAEEQLRDMLSNKSKDHKLILRMGDKTKQKYWPLVKQERLKDTACIYIADKNVPAPTWGSVASLCSETKALGVPVFPDEAALKTTVIIGARKPDGSFEAQRRHTYPFSLHYLAVCMYRVMVRPANSHDGKLDSGLPKACMIVIRFFSLYRRTSADEFRENIENQFVQAGAVMGSPVELPFFAKRVPDDLPDELEQLLIEAVQAYYGYDINKSDPIKVMDAYMTGLEKRLRESLQRHAAFLQSLTVDVAVSRNVFVSKITERVAELDSIESWTDAEAGSKSSFIQITSIDVKVDDVHSLVVSLLDEETAGDLSLLKEAMVGSNERSGEALAGSACADRRFVLETHITMAHFNETSQKDMRNLYGNLVGQGVELRVSAILWDERVAALEVLLPETTMGDASILPPSKNSFVHVTVWVQEGATAYQSNQLPSRLLTGQARRVELASPVLLLGEVSFWMA
jgi:hypothetical protein